MHRIARAQVTARRAGIDAQVTTIWRRGRVGADGVWADHGGFFAVPRTLIDGSLPAPRPWGEHDDWISETDWDFLIYAYSNGRGRTYSGKDAAREWCGIGSYDYDVLGPDTVRAMRTGIWERLEAAELALPTGRLVHGCREYFLLVPPPMEVSSPVPVRKVAATLENLEAEGEPYVLLPRALMLEKVWKQVRRHDLRRVLAAVYCFNDLACHGGVDPLRLRTEGDEILISDEFLRAAGQSEAPYTGDLLAFLEECGLVSWRAVEIAEASVVPGERRPYYLRDAAEAATCVLRPTVQIASTHEDWQSRAA